MSDKTSDAPAATEAADVDAGKQRSRNPTEEFLSIIGYVLGVSYPLFGISVLARGGYQICCSDKPGNAPWFDVVCALIYFAAAIGFFKRTRWAWKLSVVALSLEILFVVVIGTLSLFDVVGRNVWTLYGRDYGWIPTLQPLLGLLWLRRRQTRIDYGLLPADAAPST